MRKGEILVAAEQLFQHYGYAKTTVADIAREAGIGVGSVYLEFQSKDSISSALCQGHRTRVLEAMQVVRDSEGNWVERLVQLLEARILGLQGPVGTGLHGEDIIFAACEATRSVNQRFDKAETELLRDFLEEGNEAGVFAVADTPTAAAILLKIYDTISAPHAGKAGPGALRDILPTLHALVLGGVLSRQL